MNKGTQQVFLFAPLVPPAHEAEHESSPALKELYKMASLHSECSQKTVPLKELAEINPRLKSKPPAPWTEVFFIPMSDITETGRWQFRQTRLYNEVCRGGFTCFGEGDVLFAKITPCMENGKGCLVTDLDGSLGFGSIRL